MRMQSLLKVAQPWSNRFGYCPICAGRSCFVPTEAPDLVRNHAVCLRCRSSSRNRHLAKCILDAFAVRGIKTLADFRKRKQIKVYNTVSVGPLVKQMGQGENIVVSEYFDDVERGSRKGGVLCQDLERLTFPDSAFDLVISEDVFEHVVDFRKGFAEVYRVLKPGGCHIFSIPFYFDRKTRPLFEMQNGKPRLFEPIEYHGDSVRGAIPCFTHFGYDLLDFLGELGFTTRLEISQFQDDNRFGTFNSFTFISKK